MTCTPVQVGEVRAIVCTTRRKPRACACGREAAYLCDERPPAKKKTCDQPVCDRCVVSLGENRHRCPSCELRAPARAPSPIVLAPRPQEPAREQVGLFGSVPTWRSPATSAAPPAAPRPLASDERGAACVTEVDEIGAARARLVHLEISGPCATTAEIGAARARLVEVLDRHAHGLDISAPPSRWVICPDRITGSMDAAEVGPDTWRGPALRMVAEERVSVGLYEVLASGAWARRGRMGLDGRAA